MTRPVPPVKPERFHVLVVDDEQIFARAIARELERHGVSCDLAADGRSGLARSAEAQYGAILLDHRLPDEDGIRLIPTLLAHQRHAAIVMMTAYDTIPNAVQAIRQGAEDYLVKETSTRRIVAKILEIRRREELRRRDASWTSYRSHGPLGRSPIFVAALDQLARVAAHPDTTVLLTGETGVGKEVAARHLHELSQVGKGAPCVAVDCLAMPAELSESLLFGHDKGAFTGADRARPGAFEQAGSGTLFLDEIGDMSFHLQGKLLRVLESRCFKRVGGAQDRPVEARVVAATNRDLLERVRAGEFRFDLFQRLAVFPVHLPPLRERGGDRILLAEHFARFFGERLGREAQPFGEDVRQWLLRYDFPGNVRELKNIIERAVILSDDGAIRLQHLPERVNPGVFPPLPPVAGGSLGRSDRETLGEVERRLLVEAMEQAGGVKSHAARLLGISRYQLLRRLKKEGL